MRYGPLRTRFHRDHLLDGKVLMVAQIDPINLRHRAQGARCLAPQYVVWQVEFQPEFQSPKGQVETCI